MKTKLLTIACVAAFGAAMLVSCRTVATGTGNGKPVFVGQENDHTPSVVADPVPSQSPDKKPVYGSDSAQCVTNYYLYRQSFRDWENSGDDFFFEDLLPSWTYVFIECPGYRENTFINGIKILEYRISKLPENQRNGAIDTLLSIYDQRILYFGQEDFLLGEKATAMVKYYPQKMEEIFNLLSDVVKRNKLNTPNHLLVFYMQYAVDMKEAGKLDIEKLIDIYLNVDEIAHYNVTLNNATSPEYKDGIERIEQLMLKYLECGIMEKVFRPKFMADSTNLDLCKKIVALMAYNKCYDQPLFRSALNQLNRMEPTPKLLMFQARFYQSDGNYTEAVKSYLKAAESFPATEVNDKIEALLKAAEIQITQKQYQSARANILKALEIKSDDPAALIQLGDVYMYGAETCGSSFIAKYAGYWAAYDKYLKAKGLSNDPSVQNKAAEGMNNSRRRFPPTSEIFFNGMKPGQTVSSPCWIGESVTVRASDS
jgi:tetratricopeptide (TPR) repeat protein